MTERDTLPRSLAHHPSAMRAALPLLLATALAAAAPDDDAHTPPPPVAIAAWTGLTIDAALAALPPSRPVLLEFYAHWCPACQRFAPVYEQAARALDGSGVTVARVDCADEGALCTRFGVRSYPTLRVGAAAAFADKARFKELALYGGSHDAGAVAAWARAEAAKVGEKKSEAKAVVTPVATPATADTLALPAAVRERGGGERKGRGGERGSLCCVLIRSKKLSQYNPPPPPRLSSFPSPSTHPTPTKPPFKPSATPWTRARRWRSRAGGQRCARLRRSSPKRTLCRPAARAPPPLSPRCTSTGRRSTAPRHQPR